MDTAPESKVPTYAAYALAAFVVLFFSYLTATGKASVQDYELLVLVPILGAIGLHQANKNGARNATQLSAALVAQAAAPLTPTPTPTPDAPAAPLAPPAA